ncbi:lasso peptide biosynthesis B2 protein [Burkholderia gladioli]|uniref:Microcin J25-processing protein McjB C-terminal domain-containing protein n=1 Tax=Burkholderia gladioli (strain BSR3) TaxID=999541 RepID=F2LFM2_BURGS|nr:lasso peptide biosynthesis B2 protein [Burkholderia gladioli]AEA61656.1 hypothetical protein bgla_1g30450 [Burkholderia gladioli BSR3]MBW5283401.1 lasso peptide biosynthesis B2 protein [Burkholderia gladioli]
MGTKDHIYAAIFDELIILLDLKHGEYLLHTPEQWENIKSQYVTSDTQGDQGKQATITINNYRGRKFRHFNSPSWSAKNGGVPKLNNAFSLVPAFVRTIITAIFLKILGTHLSSLILLKPLRPPKRRIKSKSPFHLGVIETYKSAAFFSPFKITCLQMSFMIAGHLRQNGVDAKVTIGIRPIPFVAHAWVENGEEIYDEDPCIRDCYGVIVRLPI